MKALLARRIQIEMDAFHRHDNVISSAVGVMQIQARL